MVMTSCHIAELVSMAAGVASLLAGLASPAARVGSIPAKGGRRGVGGESVERKGAGK